eukprot:305608-Chlamydomonas_euryale.AAC.5
MKSLQDAKINQKKERTQKLKSSKVHDPGHHDGPPRVAACCRWPDLSCITGMVTYSKQLNPAEPHQLHCKRIPCTLRAG